jgi:hypothetical protein
VRHYQHHSAWGHWLQVGIVVRRTNDHCGAQWYRRIVVLAKIRVQWFSLHPILSMLRSNGSTGLRAEREINRVIYVITSSDLNPRKDISFMQEKWSASGVISTRAISPLLWMRLSASAIDLHCSSYVAESSTLPDTLKVPATVGVPLMTPRLLRVRPSGSGASRLKVYGGIPPVALMIPEYD